MDTYTTANAPPRYPDEPLMYPIRFTIARDPNLFQFFAYPSQRPPRTLIQLETGIPAIVEYVLGPAWREQLNRLNRLYVSQANWTNDDESSIALQILRGGGAIMDTTSIGADWWLFEDGFGSSWTRAEQQQKYIFGWPADGGVWVLHVPAPLEIPSDPNESLDFEWSFAQKQRDPNRAVSRNFDGSIDFANLTNSKTMVDLCNNLKMKGAVYYDKLEESAEVIESGLLNEETVMKKQPIMEPRPIEVCESHLL